MGTGVGVSLAEAELPSPGEGGQRKAAHSCFDLYPCSLYAPAFACALLSIYSRKLIPTLASPLSFTRFGFLHMVLIGILNPSVAFWVLLCSLFLKQNRKSMPAWNRVQNCSQPMRYAGRGPVMN